MAIRSYKRLNEIMAQKRGWVDQLGYPDDSIKANANANDNSSYRTNDNTSVKRSLRYTEYWHSFQKIKDLLNHMVVIRSDSSGSLCASVQSSHCSSHNLTLYTNNHSLAEMETFLQNMRACGCHSQQSGYNETVCTSYSTHCTCKDTYSHPCVGRTTGAASCHNFLTCTNYHAPGSCDPRDAVSCSCNGVERYVCTCNRVKRFI